MSLHCSTEQHSLQQAMCAIRGVRSCLCVARRCPVRVGGVRGQSHARRSRGTLCAAVCWAVVRSQRLQHTCTALLLVGRPSIEGARRQPRAHLGLVELAVLGHGDDDGDGVGAPRAAARSPSEPQRNLACRFTASATWAYVFISRRFFRPRQGHTISNFVWRRLR